MNKWFLDTFLPSLFDRAGTNNPIWLTQKQTAVCVQNMEQHTAITHEYQGCSFAHLWFSCEWASRNVILQYSKRNGCGTIRFSLNPKEAATYEEEHKKERERIESERVARLKKNPDRLKKEIGRLQKEISSCKTALSWDDNTIDDINFFTDKLKKAEAKFSKLL